MADAQELLSQIACSGLDAATGRKRYDVLQELIQENDKERSDDVLAALVSDNLGKSIATKCSTKNAQKRIAKIFLLYLIQAAASSSADAEVVDSIAQALCTLLVHSHSSTTLLDYCLQTLTVTVEKSRSKKNQTEVYTTLSQSFQRILTNEAIVKEGQWAPCLSILSHITNDDSNDDELSQQLAQTFLSHTFTSKTKIIPSNLPQLIQLSKAYLSSNLLSQSIFDESFASPLGLKLRANPESILESVAVLVESLNPSHLDLSSHLLPSGNSGSDAKLLLSAMKQLTSPKENLNTLAMDFMTHLSKLSGSSNHNAAYQSKRTIVQVLAYALGLKAQPKTTSPLPTSATSLIPTLSTVDQRSAAYTLIHDLLSVTLSSPTAVEYLERGSEGYSDLESICELSLKALVPAIGKEGSGSNDAKALGVKALFVTMSLSKRLAAKEGGDGKDVVDGEGYKGAIKFLTQPIVEASKLAMAKEFRLRVGSLFVNISSTTMTWSRIHAVLDDLLTGGAGAEKIKVGLTQLVDAAVKKHSKSDIVPQIDGLLALYLLLVEEKSKSIPVLPPSAKKVLSSGSSGLSSKTSFLYSNAMTDAASTDDLAALLLHRTIGMYMTSEGSDGDPLVCVTKSGAPSAAAMALATCATSTRVTKGSVIQGEEDDVNSTSLEATLEPILGTGTASDALTNALFTCVNTKECEKEAIREDDNLSKEFQESTSTTKGQTFVIDGKTVRCVASTLMKTATDAKRLSEAFVLTHFGTSLRVSGRLQRDGLDMIILDLIGEVILPKLKNLSEEDKKSFTSQIVEFVVTCSSSHTFEHGSSEEKKEEVAECSVSEATHEAAMSLLTTMGRIAGNYDAEYSDPDDEDSERYGFAWSFCVDQVADGLSSQLKKVFEEVEKLSKDDIGLYHSSPGVVYRTGTEESSTAKVAVRKNKADYEDEEWERQVAKELAEKKAKEQGSSGTVALSAEDKKLVEKQSGERKHLQGVLNKTLPRAFASIQALCVSEIEVGNACLASFADVVLSVVVSKCSALALLPSMARLANQTMSALATCVYEIDESHSSALVEALYICHRKSTSDSSPKTFTPLPNPCDAASLIISEIDEYGECLTASSFNFIFPIIRAALAGPRNVPGCEGALVILNLHAELVLSNTQVYNMRKDMASVVLELLSHDRSQTFKDPTPIETLCNIYDSSEPPFKIKTAQLAPLLGDSGAMGEVNCRIASMIALNHVLSENPKLIKTDPLLENRVWMNCFASDDRIKEEARKAWKSAHGVDENDEVLPPPSKMFAIPLLPQLSHKNADIANAASEAFATAVEEHSDAIEKNATKLLNAYIVAFPNSFDDDEPKPAPAPVAKAPIAKKTAKPKTSIGLTTKKVGKKKPSSSMSMLTKTKKKTTKKNTLTAFAPKKKDPQIDKAFLESQFQSDASKVKKDKEKDSAEKISVRSGVLQVVSAMCQSSRQINFNFEQLQLLVGFLLAYGLADGNDDVRASARNTLSELVAENGSSKEAMDFLMPLLESSLKSGKPDKGCLGTLATEKVLENDKAADQRKEGVVIALGAAAIHETDAKKIDETIDMLISALSTPSESVQSNVALCLSKLMKKGNTQDRIEDVIEKLMTKCLEDKSLAVRRGAAYGISAAVKGSGIGTLKKFQIVKQLEDACNTGSSDAKEGALFAIELLSNRLGLLFEPYVITLLPALLSTFGDSSVHVRAAASASIGLIMSKLSGHGVRLLLPAVLAGLENEDWRTKQASIQMLGSMGHLAPKQLSSCLPKVVPQLTEAFSDTHPKVKASAKESLEEISKVIRNPEVSSISPILLEALTDPANATATALESLIETEFLHAIDAPSLALIVPVLHRGLRDRAATTKRIGALIAGNICTMINNPKEFVPYLPTLLPDLKLVLVDPIPDCRSTSAKALGSLTRSLGESTFPELRPWLIDTLKDEGGSSVERSGAAQGLTEVLCAGGASLVESVIGDEILPLINHPKANTREGVLWVLTFLPSALGQAFAPLITSSFPVLISGLSDDAEGVRDVAMRAGRVMIRCHGKAHVDQILPSLEDGLCNDDYRIRVASLNLLGDLLSSIGGTKIAKGEGDTQDDIRQAERAQAQIALVLGPETRKRVLSSLYLRRSDSAAVVRQNAVQVWKTVVSVTPRTLRDILSSLLKQIVSALASGHEENTQVAGRCLGDIVSKLGDMVLPGIIPVLRNALKEGDVDTRLGACVGLTELIGCSSKEQISKYLDVLVKVVQDALCDEDEDVQSMAASCFQSLYNVVGDLALNEVVPVLLAAMESSSTDDNARHRAITGLTGILKIRSKELLPYLIPRMLVAPMSINQCSALSNICSVTGHVIYTFFSSIVPAIINELIGFFGVDSDEEEKLREKALRDCFRSICSSVAENGVNVLVSQIANKCSSDREESMRKEGCWMMQVVAEERKEQADFYEQLPIMYRELLYRLNDDSMVVVKTSNAALLALSKSVPAEVLVTNIEFIRNLIASIVSEARRRKGGVGDGEFFLPGFNMPKGLEPLLPIYQRGILFGDASIRQASAAGLGELIHLTANKYLAGAFIIKLTGPLLRIVGDRNPSSVKIAIIQTLGLILKKGGPALRPFAPQFQTTFFKALSDPARQVRLEAIQGLATLMPLSTRLDPLIKELVSNALGKGGASTNMEDRAALIAIQTAMFEALATVLRFGGTKAKLPESIPSALEAGKEMYTHEDAGVREGASKVIGLACALRGVDTMNEFVSEDLLPSLSDKSDVSVKHGSACCIRHILESSIGSELEDESLGSIKKNVETLLSDDERIVRESACVAIGAIIGVSDAAYVNKMEGSILKRMNMKEDMEVLQSMAKGLYVAMKMNPDILTSGKSMAIIDAALANAMSGNQRVQTAFQNVLWMALKVGEGEDGVNAYCNEAMFETSKKMKSLYTKVLLKIKEVNFD